MAWSQCVAEDARVGPVCRCRCPDWEGISRKHIHDIIFTQDIFEHHGSRAKPGAHYISCAQFRFPLNSMPSEMMSHLLCLARTGRKHKWTVIFVLFCLFSGSIIIPWLPKQTCMVHQCFKDLVVPKYGICVAFEAELLVRHSSVLTTQLSP